MAHRHKASITRSLFPRRFLLVAIGFFLGRVNGHRVFLAARLHDEFSSLEKLACQLFDEDFAARENRHIVTIYTTSFLQRGKSADEKAIVETRLYRCLSRFAKESCLFLTQMPHKIPFNCQYLSTNPFDHSESSFCGIRAILSDEFHPSYNLFQLLPSKKRMRSYCCKTDRFLSSFYPSAVRLYNR